MPAFIAAAAVGAGIAAGVSVATGVIAASAFATAFWSAFISSVVIGGLSMALAKKPERGDTGSLSFDAGNRTVSVRQPTAPRRVVVGECRIGGIYTFMYSHAGSIANQIFSVCVTLTGHRIKAIDDLYFNDERVPFTSGADPLGHGRTAVSGTYANRLFVRVALGTTTQTANPYWIDVTNGAWTSAHTQLGCSNIQLDMLRNGGVFAQGMPNPTVRMRGWDEIYDPRNSPGETKWTKNPALILAAYLCGSRDTVGGLEVDYATGIDEAALITAANICDERVSNRYQPEFTVTAGSPSPNSITFSADQKQIVTGDAVRYVTTGAEAAPLQNNAIYYLVKLTDTTGQLASTRADAIAETPVLITLTGTGSGTQTLERCATFTVTAGSPQPNTLALDAENKRLYRGDGVRVFAIGIGSPVSGGVLPSGLSDSTTYYYIRVDDSTFSLATTYEDALAGTAVNIISAGTGTFAVYSMDEPRYTCDGSWLTSEKPRDIIQRILSSMAGMAVKVGARWRIQAGAYVTPTGDTLTIGELRGPIRITPMAARRDNCNGVRGVITGPESNWQPTDFPSVQNSSYVTLDDEEEMWRDIELPFTIRPSTAKRLAKIELERTRQALTVFAPCKLSAYRFQPGDTLNFTFERYGWSPKVFEVLDGQFSIAEDGTLGYDLTLRETASAVYDWTQATDGAGLDLAPNTTLAVEFAPAESDRAYYGPGSTANVSTLGTILKGRTLLALADHTIYPNYLAELRSTFSGQFVCGGTAESVYTYYFVLPYSSKPTTAGTLAIAYSGTVLGNAIYNVTGTGTDFTLLAVGDYIYSTVGRPMMIVHSITNATACQISLLGTAVSSSSFFPVSGWSWTAYRPVGSASNTPSSDLRDFTASAVQDATFRTGVVLEPSLTAQGIMVGVIAGGLGGFTVDVKAPAIDSQWVLT